MIVIIVIPYGFQIYENLDFLLNMKCSYIMESKLDIFGKTQDNRAPGASTILCKKQFTGINH